MTGLFNNEQRYEPRASRILVPGRADLPTELWMGGANGLLGERLQPEHFSRAWLLDLAGEMPDHYRRSSLLWLPRVFTDIESVPANYARLLTLAGTVAAVLSNEPCEGELEHPRTPPDRVFVMCQQGLNRSGLLTGLILRALGVSAEDAIAAVATRPGALANQTFARLVREWPEGDRRPES